MLKIHMKIWVICSFAIFIVFFNNAKGEADFGQQIQQISIHNYVFGRFSIHFDIPSEIKSTQIKKISSEIKKNLRLSGFYTFLKSGKNADITLRIRKISPSRFHFALKSQKQTFYSKKINAFNSKNVVRSTISDFVYQLTGQSSVLGNAIVYTEKGSYPGYRLVVTDPLNEKRKVILNDGNLNILPR